MTDFATLAIKIDASEADQAAKSLDGLTAAGVRTEREATNLVSAHNKVTVSAGAQHAAMQQLSYQIGDVSQGFAMGVNPMVIFAQQGGQVVQALSLMKGGASGLIGFLAGPWGAVIMGAAMVVGTFASKLLESGDAADTAGKKYRDAADEARGLIGAMNAMALNEKRINLNKLTESRMEKENLLSSGTRSYSSVRAKDAGFFGSSQQIPAIEAEIRAIRLEEEQTKSLISIAEKANAVAERSAAATHRSAAGHHANAAGARASSGAMSEATREAERLAVAMAKIGESANDNLLQFGVDTVKRREGDWAAEYNDMMAGIKATGQTAADQFLALGNAMADYQTNLDKLGQNNIADAFGRGGAAINQMADAVRDLAKAEADRNAALALAGNDETAKAKINGMYKKAELGQTVALIGAAKGLFAEKSAGYKAMEAAEKALAAVQMINTIKGVAAGAANMFSQLGVFAFPAVAAMLGVMAAVGFSGGSSGVSGPSAADLQKAQGTGSILGDSEAKSGSVGNALSIMVANSNKDIEYGSQMVRSLRSIEDNIGNLGSLIARQMGVSGGMFDSSKLGLGAKTTSGIGGFLFPGLSQLPIIGGIIKALFGTTTTATLKDQGLTFNPQTVASIMANGVNGNTYQDVETNKKKKFFGITYSNKNSTQTTLGGLDSGMEDQIGLLVGSLRTSIMSAASVLGINGAGAAMDAFTVSIGKISLMGLKGAEIQQALEDVFSKLGDDMATAALPIVTTFQKVGEGAFETMARLAKDYATIDGALKLMSMTFGDVGMSSIAAREYLVELFGSLDEFTAQTQFFTEHFLTAAEQIAPIATAVSAEMARLGLSGVTTKDQFKDIVTGLDLATMAGQELFTSMMSVAPAFAKVSDYYHQTNQKIIDDFTSYGDALRKYRETLVGGQSGSSFAAIRAQFNATSASAAMGDGTAMGKLQGASSAFLDAAKKNASSNLDYQRAVGQVLASVDKAIFAADTTVDYAQLQIDAINNTADILAQMKAELATLQQQSNVNSDAMLRLWQRIQGGDGIAINNNSGEPLQVVVAS